ncbi:MAG: cytochrome d ubiquinol oxidase subunit II [Streptosporangiaceae bacterium]
MAFVPFWFILITILWTGFFVLEGFDMGVGMLHGVVGRDEPGRRAVINTIGPLWDGNEVWLIVAGAAMFAAFPGWYATMFSGFYLALVLLLCALMVRGVSFEYRGKRDAVRWRRTWDVLLTTGSLLAPLLIGIALGDLLHGLPIGANHEYTGNFWNLLQPYGIFVGIALVSLCVLHGATFIALKTTGDLRDRARRLARRVAPATALLVLAFVAWTHVEAGGGAFLNPVEFLAILAVLAAWALVNGHEGWAFTATTVAIGLSIITLFVDLYPNVMVSSTSPAYNLTVHNSASPPYSLKVTTVVALVLLPIVLAYQAWTYYVFRRRISDKDFRPALATTPRPAVSATVAMATPADSATATAGVRRRRWGLHRRGHE